MKLAFIKINRGKSKDNFPGLIIGETTSFWLITSLPKSTEPFGPELFPKNNEIVEVIPGKDLD